MLHTADSENLESLSVSLYGNGYHFCCGILSKRCEAISCGVAYWSRLVEIQGSFERS